MARRGPGSVEVREPDPTGSAAISLSCAAALLVIADHVERYHEQIGDLVPHYQQTDQADMINALVEAERAAVILMLMDDDEAARRMGLPIGRLVIATLNAHGHEAAMQAYDHVNLGVTAETLDRWLRKAGLIVESCRITSRDPRPPYFEVVTALARRPAA